MYEAKILKDSVSPDGARLTTFEVTIPRIVLAEFNTHRMFSRNSASSRAIPVKKNIEMVEEDPFIPEVFAVNQKGMQGDVPLEDNRARHIWVAACADAVAHASALEEVGLHKALANRILEPFKWHTIIVTATEWSNFFALRTAKEAQYEIRKPAQMMKDLYEASIPSRLDFGEWHLPLVDTEWRGKELYRAGIARATGPNWDYWKAVSVGRCARVSYLTHDGVRDPEKDIALHDMLKSNGHLSPFEHVAKPGPCDCCFSGNFKCFHQYRKDIPNESDFSQND